MIFVDTTKSGPASHRSGLVRVTSRLVAALGPAAQPVEWTAARQSARASDWFLTAELFSEAERPGFTAFLDAKSCRLAAVFHDAIPLKLPHITWPQSVARHPGYLKLLAKFDRVFAVSQASKAELQGFWRWCGISATPPVEVLALGADFAGQPRAQVPNPAAPPLVLGVGIVEPRKNQAFMVAVCEELWREGLAFELHLVGRENPHFGRPIGRAIKRAARSFSLIWHQRANDEALLALYRRARLSVFPTIAEGCGLPLLESLWMGVPCLCSDLPVLRENADDGGCCALRANDAKTWQDHLRRALTDAAWWSELQAAARARAVPTWAETAAQVVSNLDA